MEHQYPAAISGDESMLAELMLPDQAHARKEDWTIFFLHKDTGEEDEGKEEEGQENEGDQEQETTVIDTSQEIAKDDDEKDKEGDPGDQQDEPEGGEGPPLIYVLNLVNTKHDASAKRCE